MPRSRYYNKFDKVYTIMTQRYRGMIQQSIMEDWSIIFRGGGVVSDVLKWSLIVLNLNPFLIVCDATAANVVFGAPIFVIPVQWETPYILIRAAPQFIITIASSPYLDGDYSTTKRLISW